MQSILLIGVNHLGTLIAERMQDLGHEVMAVDKDEERINEIQDIVTDAQIGDAVNEGFLRSLGVNEVTAGDFIAMEFTAGTFSIIVLNLTGNDYIVVHYNLFINSLALISLESTISA